MVYVPDSCRLIKKVTKVTAFQNQFNDTTTLQDCLEKVNRAVSYTHLTLPTIYSV